MTDSSLLNLSYHSAGKFATGPPSRAINMRTRITQPSGAATPSEQRHASCASLFRRLSAFFGSAPNQGSKAAKFAVLPPGHAGFPNRVKRSEGSDTTPVRKAPVSACKPLCAILLRKPSVYPLSPVKANVGRLCERLKNAMKSGLGRSCSGNFLAIVAGTILSEKLNLTGGFFEWRRPFDFSTDRL